jgi:hypothetical protein
MSMVSVEKPPECYIGTQTVERQAGNGTQGDEK